jgi:hypothetical protein
MDVHHEHEGLEDSKTPKSPNEGGQSLPAAPEVAPMPHERDESTDDMSGPVEKSMELAKGDIDANRQDTTRAMEANDTYQKQK